MKVHTLCVGAVALGLIGISPLTYRHAAAQAQTGDALLPDGVGKAEFLAGCSQCHSAEGTVVQRRTADDWKAVVDRMTTLGAVLDPQERERVLTYLTSNFGTAGSALAAAPTASAQHRLSALNGHLTDYLEMPSTGDFALRDARSQVARINFLVEEPGGLRMFIGDSAGPLYLADKRTKKIVPFINFNGSNGLKGLFPRFVADASFASGLLALTFDPAYHRNGIFYTIHLEDMTNPAPAAPKSGVIAGLDSSGFKPTPGIPTPSGPAPLIREAVVAEWTDRNLRNTTFEGSVREVLRVQLMNGIHPTNDLAFNPAARRGDPDWRVLYIATGDGGAGEQTDVRRLNPQRLDHFGGKIIRIVPDVREHATASRISQNGQYRIPNDNPFVSTPGARAEIWATGMRNPHRMAWDGANLLAFVIGSNGAAPGPRYETINLVRRGANFGYPLREGPEFKALSPIFGAVPTDNTVPLRISDTVVSAQRVPLQDSALAYNTTVEGNAIANGFVYRGRKWPALRGAVVFGDITSGRIFYAKMTDLVSATDGNPTTLADFGEIQTDLPKLAAERMRSRTPSAPSPAPATSDPAARPRPFRVDMRLATDSQGEIYVLTKSDGMIRRITNIE